MATNNPNIHSEYVKVYPAAKRITSAYYQDSRLMSEQNINSVVNRLTDSKPFTMTKEITQNTTSVEFNINGYLFTITGDKTNNNSALEQIKTAAGVTEVVVGAEIYAYIKIEDYMLDGIDTQEGYFTGLYFQGIVPNEISSENKLLIAKCTQTKDDTKGIQEKWEAPDASMRKFTILSIDGGVDTSSQPQ